jgi:hypothetical protein
VSYATQALGCTISLAALFIFTIWTKTLAFVAARQASDRGRITSYALLAAFVLVPNLFGSNSRNSQNELLTKGLSLENVTEMVLAIAAFAWAIRLLVTRAVNVSCFTVGVNFWIGLNLALYALSMAWSLWPSLTAFRTMELGAFWILTVQLFSGRPPLSALTWSLLVAAFLLMIGPVFLSWELYSHSQLFGFFVSNTGGILAGALMVIVLHRLLILGETRGLFFLIPSLAAFILFGSLGSTTALLFATVTLLIFRLGRHLGPVTQLMAVTYALPLIALCLYAVLHANPDAQAWLSSVSGKPPEMIGQASGRVKLWEEMWKLAPYNIFGYGFGAAERLLFQLLSSISIGFDASNAHNGFLAAWLTAGWLGAWGVIFLFVAATFDAAKRPYFDRSYMLPTIIFLAINNLSIAGVGGSHFNPGWFVMMVLACAAPVPETARSLEKPRNAYSLSGVLR